MLANFTTLCLRQASKLSLQFVVSAALSAEPAARRASQWENIMQLPRRPIMRFAAGAAALPIVSFVAIAEDFPSRPITWVAPFPAGGPVDTLARIVTEPISRVLGQPIVIENVSGAAGSIGIGRVARAPPDGYTLIQGIWSTHVLNGAVYRLSYDVLNDFAPIAP